MENLTFLYRAPKIDLAPLGLGSIARTYQKVLNVPMERGKQLAKLTLGYSFAFQALGYTYWNAMPVKSVEDVLPRYDAMLSNSAYIYRCTHQGPASVASRVPLWMWLQSID